MADPMVIDSESKEKPAGEMRNPERENSGVKTSVKRKRASAVESLTAEEREARVRSLKLELEGLFRYYRELLHDKLNFDLRGCGTSNSVIACLLEGSSLSFSKLVGEIYQKMKDRVDGSGNGTGITLASVKSSVHFVGQRLLYGLTNPDADVFEDETDSCLWCWETRDMKLLPKSLRGMLKIQRICRKKIHERISAVSDMITALQKSESIQSCGHDLTKASERLGKVLSEVDIRMMVQSMVQKNGAEMAEKEVKKEEKKLIKETERSKREEEKEKKRMDRELMKEKWQSEKELKRLQSEAEKEERRREKEEAELRKQSKRKQEDTEKDQRQREKEEAEQKRQLSLQKQASLMERFLKRSKNNLTCQNDQSSHATTSSSSPNKCKKISESVTLSMDCALLRKDEMNADDIHKSHLIAWRHLGHATCSHRKQHWGIRQKPKSEVIKEIKLGTSKGLVREDELSIEKLVDGWSETNVDGRSDNMNSDSSLPCSQNCKQYKQLLQFDKSNRPAFYGIWPKKSQVVGPRHPFKKDPDLDYEIDSDEEWEEEEPGESLSDCDKDDEEESLEEGCSKADCEDDSEDGFFVPDGYLSENEGVQVDRRESDCVTDEVNSSPACKLELANEEIHVLLQQQKQLHKLTEHALRKNQPLIISNTMHEKDTLVTAEDLIGIPKLEQMCLQALSMRAFPGGPCIEISVVGNGPEDEEDARSSMNKECANPVANMQAISESDLPEIVSTIQSCQHGINKVVESLQQKFPAIPKSQLKNKVREISDFVDNRWQVKKNVLNKLGLSISPDKSCTRTKSIATFFSRRCLPPAGDGQSIKSDINSLASVQKASTPQSTKAAGLSSE